MTESGAQVEPAPPHQVAPQRSLLTLLLTMSLHAFTHAYGVMLVPLYLMMVSDLRVSGVKAVALVVTIYGTVYFLLSYPAGMLTDRLNRKALLGIGLIGNALAVCAMALTSNYGVLLAMGVAAGICGTLYHPAANALAPAHYPRSPGLALGIIGIGSGIGFFAGLQYSGWRAQTVQHLWWPGLRGGRRHAWRWDWPAWSSAWYSCSWREAGAHGMGNAPAARMGKGARRRTLAIALLSSCRDFAGVGSVSLLSVYLQKAHGFDARRTGWLIGAMGLISVVATPLAVWLTSGRRRLAGLACAMIGGGLVLASIPHVPIRWLLAVLTLFQIFHLGSYAISEVSLIERADPPVRGRMMGLYLTIAGTVGGISPWAMGLWTDHLPGGGRSVSSYVPIFSAMGVLMMLSASAMRLLRRLGTPHAPSKRDVGEAISSYEA